MLCLQCEETAKGQGCVKLGVCGKPPEVAYLQDLLVYVLGGLALCLQEARETGIDLNQINAFLCEALFSTKTNVNFDKERMREYLKRTIDYRDELKWRLSEKSRTVPSHEAVDFVPAQDEGTLLEQAKRVSPETRKEVLDPEVFYLSYTLLVALKGIAAYAYHAQRLGKEDQAIYDFLYKGLAAYLEPQKVDVASWLGLLLEAGKVNLRTMELLDEANTSAYGHPKPTVVPLGHKAGKAVLISGHDLRDLELLLRQTADKGVYVYTHGEMLPAHGYPKLKEFGHLYGHYGTSWANQQKEFPLFPGPILMTTNCLVPPKEDYKGRLFTCGPVGYPGVKHVRGEDFSEVIKTAFELPGFDTEEEKGQVMVGFARNAVMELADKVLDAVREGKIRHFFLVGGCDGRKKERDYYREFVLRAPKDTVVLTLACGKFRFFAEDLGTIEGIPRILDMGQCNDAYSAIKVAQALADALGVEVNQLPLTLVVSWYEQKALAILLTLLYLGIKGIMIGPSLPAFLTPKVLELLRRDYDIRTVTDPLKDLAQALSRES